MPTPEQLNHSHPTIKQFARKLSENRVSAADEAGFRRWVEGPKPKDEEREVGRALLAEFESLGEKAKSNLQGSTAGMQPASPPRGHGRGSGGGGQAPPKARPNAAADPKVLGEPFHNPYTFIPFGEAPHRRTPTPLTIDEREPDRFTGVLELEIRTLSPLMTCKGTPEDPKAEHKTYRALTIGDDVIVPATGVRGSLRSLLTILAGGTLGYLDESIWLCQGRDVNLGPAGKSSPPGTPDRVFMGKITKVGTSTRDGEVQLGSVELVSADRPEIDRLDGSRPGKRVGSDQREVSRGVVAQPDGRLIRLSGRPVQKRGKREAIFKPSGETIVLPAGLWEAFSGRHRHADIKELKIGDLVWLEPSRPELTQLRDSNDVKSIQWARWGRRGERLLDLVKRCHPEMVPDAFNPDGKVDEVTDLFGMVPRQDLAKVAFPNRDGEPAAAFSARVRPENLVFRGGAKHLDRAVAMAPLAPPHPGCIAFYRDQDDLDEFSQRDPLRGYKVYRTTVEEGSNAPWLWSTQAVYGEQGRPLDAKSKLNKTCDLLAAGQLGTLRIACRALAARELELLLAACGVDWRLGGGKPLGLGHCRVVTVRMIDERGQSHSWALDAAAGSSRDREVPSVVGGEWLSGVHRGDASEERTRALTERCRIYQASQRPVPKLRYPRAVSENNNRKQRGGHAWFQRHASASKTGTPPTGLEVLWIHGALQTRVGNEQLRPQPLPAFNPEAPTSDVLYGHDLVATDIMPGGRSQPTRQGGFEPFDPDKHARSGDASGGKQTPNADDRRRQREARE
jgi:hypothetical protein